MNQFLSLSSKKQINTRKVWLLRLIPASVAAWGRKSVHKENYLLLNKIWL
jgi:hypothetical protein